MSFHLPIPSWNTRRRRGIVMSTLSFRRRSLPTFPPLFTISRAAASQRRSSLFSASLLGLGAMLWRCGGCLARHGFACSGAPRAACGSCVARGERLGLDARLPKTGFLSRPRALERSIVGNRPVLAMLHGCPMLASVLQAASQSALQALCSGHDRRTREARRHLQRDWNALTHKHGADSRDAAACPARQKPKYWHANASRGATGDDQGRDNSQQLGVVRLAKFYEQVHVTGESAEQAQQSVIKKIYRAVSKRQDNQCNYLEGSIPEWGGDTFLYTHYARLFHGRVYEPGKRPRDDLIQVFVEG